MEGGISLWLPLNSLFKPFPSVLRFRRADVNIRSKNGLLVMWLQNSPGYQRWGPTEDRVEALLEAFRPGKERERDKQELLSPSRTNNNTNSISGATPAAVVAGTTTVATTVPITPTTIMPQGNKAEADKSVVVTTAAAAAAAAADQ